MVNISEIKSGVELSDKVRKLLGYSLEQVRKEWVISGVEENISGVMETMLPECEPSDPIELVDVLELFQPNMTALQLERIKLSHIWTIETSSSSQSGFYGGCSQICTKVLNAERLYKVLSEIFG